MKRIIIAAFLILLAKVSPAQQDLLSFDEHNKYIYYQVVDIPGITADSLHGRGWYFLKTTYPKYKLKNPNAGSITGEGRFMIYNGLSILKHEGGEISYQLNIEFKDQKYRYWLTSFIFTPYERDRYGNFVPKLGIEIPLETAQSKLDKKELDNYLNETGAFCKQFGDKLKLSMTTPLRKEEVVKKEEAKKVVTDKW